jgi:hypothetical protein
MSTLPLRTGETVGRIPLMASLLPFLGRDGCCFDNSSVVQLDYALLLPEGGRARPPGGEKAGRICPRVCAEALHHQCVLATRLRGLKG